MVLVRERQVTDFSGQGLSPKATMQGKRLLVAIGFRSPPPPSSSYGSDHRIHSAISPNPAVRR